MPLEHIQPIAWNFQPVSTILNSSADHHNHSTGLGRTPAISLRGLVGPLDRPKDTGFVVCEIRESWPFLEDFCSQVQRAIPSNGFLPVPSSQPHAVFRIKVMQLKWFPTDVANHRINLRGRGRVRSPNFDASDLLQKYKEVEWTTEFPLERLCISELGLKDFWEDGELVRTGFHDIVCVPLPGVPARVVNELATQRSNEEHEKAYKSIRRNLPTCPLRIPSTPSL